MLSNDDVLILPYSEDDLDNYIQTEMEEYSFADTNPNDLKQTGREVFAKAANTEYFSIFLCPGKIYCGKIELQHRESLPAPGIGIQILKRFRNQGIGTTAIKKFCYEIHESRGIDNLCVMIERTNTASIHLFEKLGARYEGMKVALALDEVLRKAGITIDPALLDMAKVRYYTLSLLSFV